MTLRKWCAALAVALCLTLAMSSRAVTFASDALTTALLVAASLATATLGVGLLRFQRGVAFLLFKIVAVPSSVVAAAFFTCGAVAFPREQVARVNTRHGEFAAYRVDCAAMCDSSIDVQRERRVLGMTLGTSERLPRSRFAGPCGVAKESGARFELSPGGERLTVVVRNYAGGDERDCPFVLFDDAIGLSR